VDTLAFVLSRLQFAFTVSFHIIFPSLSIGLIAWLTVLEALHLGTGRPAGPAGSLVVPAPGAVPQRPMSVADEPLESSVAPIWDGNETWLVATGVVLWGAFPIVYATLMSAFYLPLPVW
jgi:hypothetical protein